MRNKSKECFFTWLYCVCVYFVWNQLSNDMISEQHQYIWPALFRTSQSLYRWAPDVSDLFSRLFGHNLDGVESHLCALPLINSFQVSLARSLMEDDNLRQTNEKKTLEVESHATLLSSNFSAKENVVVCATRKMLIEEGVLTLWKLREGLQHSVGKKKSNFETQAMKEWIIPPFV